MNHPTPVSALVAGVPGPGKPVYQMWRADPGAGDVRGTPAGTFPSLTDAMSAAGQLINAHWFTRPGQPDLLFLADSAAGYSTLPEDLPETPIWTIEAAGVAREYADSIPAALRACRSWLPSDLADGKAPVVGAHAVPPPVPAGAWVMMVDGKPGQLPRLGATPASQDPLERVLAASWRFFARLGTAERRFYRWWARLWRPVWVVRVPAGKLPCWLCRRVSYLISHGLIPYGVFLGGIWMAWRLAFPAMRRTWRGTWYGGWQGHAVGTWYPDWRGVALWAAAWFAVGAAAEKLVNVRLQPRPGSENT
jgi:hypothetical protein